MLRIAVLAIISSVSFQAHAVTIDFGSGRIFDTDRDFIDDTYIEKGVVAGPINGYLTLDFEESNLHFDIDGHANQNVSFFTGSRFTLDSFDVKPQDFDCSREHCRAYRNVVVTGYRSGAQVAQDRFSMRKQPLIPWTYTARPKFKNIDMLAISTYAPDLPEYQDSEVQFWVDNLTLAPRVTGDRAPAPVPVPASGALLAGAMLSALAARRRAR